MVSEITVKNRKQLDLWPKSKGLEAEFLNKMHLLRLLFIEINLKQEILKIVISLGYLEFNIHETNI